MSAGTEIDRYHGFKVDEETLQFVEGLKELNYISHAAIVASVVNGLPCIEIHLLANRVPILLGKEQDREVLGIYELYLKYASVKSPDLDVLVNTPLSPIHYTPKLLAAKLEEQCRKSGDFMFFMMRSISPISIPEETT